jgi:hypothetical protein
LHFSVSITCFSKPCFQSISLSFDLILSCLLACRESIFFFSEILKSILFFNLYSSYLVFEFWFDIVIDLPRVFFENSSVTHEFWFFCIVYL